MRSICNKRAIITSLSVLIILGMNQRSIAGDIVAFSLREADRILGQGQIDNPELQRIAGITRFAGMVFDRQNKDIILVGSVREDCPPASIDDLVVALRSRLHKADWPRVSIDRVEDTNKTGKQAVRFDGGIENSLFGRDFLKSDILLKRYSLNLLDRIDGITPYLEMYEERTKENLSEKGKKVDEVKWLSDSDSKKTIEQNYGSTVNEESMIQSRFWFYVKGDESYIVEKDDVYVIEKLQLGVKAETLANAGSNIRHGQSQDDIGDEFSRQFSKSFLDASKTHPVLQRLKVLFDMVAISEGIANLDRDRPVLKHLIDNYHVREEKTPEAYDLVVRTGEFSHNKDVVALVQLSGGIELEAIQLALEDGDVSALKSAVLKSRPSSRTLSWRLPLDRWEMPNSLPLYKGRGNQNRNSTVSEPKEIGFGITVQRYVLDDARSGRNKLKFTGFSKPPSMPSIQVPQRKLRVFNRMSLSSRIPFGVEKATLEGDWSQITRLLKDVDTQSTPPVERLLKAHAFLAINRNNDSFRLFSTVNDVDLTEWSKWSNDLAKRYPNNSYAHFYRADALSRLKKYDKAIVEFTKAIKLDAINVYAFHGRGITYVLMKSFNEAGKDIAKAQEIAPNIADFHNSRGMLRIAQQKGNPILLEKQFKRAIELSNDFALAWHGLGCIELLRGSSSSEEQLAKARALLAEERATFGRNEKSIYNIINSNNVKRITHIKPTGSAKKIKHISRSTSFSGHGTQIPGGAAIDKSKVVWDKSPWPFHPLFGLHYLSISTDEPNIKLSKQKKTGN